MFRIGVLVYASSVLCSVIMIFFMYFLRCVHICSLLYKLWPDMSGIIFFAQILWFGSVLRLAAAGGLRYEITIHIPETCF